MIKVNGIEMDLEIQIIPSHKDNEYILVATEPLTEAELVMLKASTWETEDAYVVTGMDTLVDARYHFKTSITEMEKTQQKLALKEKEIKKIIADARQGLISPPTPGEEWDSQKWYCSGDTVVYDSVNYTCLKTCKGHAPGDANYWTVTPQTEEPTPWADIPSGDTIAAGTLVTYNELTWRCIKEHAKSIVKQPSAVQTDYWEVADA